MTDVFWVFFFFIFAIQRFHFEMRMMKDGHQTRRLRARQKHAVRLVNRSHPAGKKRSPSAGRRKERATCPQRGAGRDSASGVGVGLLEVGLALVSRMIVNL